MECRGDRITGALTSFSGPSILATWPPPPGERRVTSRSGLLPLACGTATGGATADRHRKPVGAGDGRFGGADCLRRSPSRLGPVIPRGGLLQMGGEDGGLDPAVHAQFGQQTRDVVLDGL